MVAEVKQRLGLPALMGIGFALGIFAGVLVKYFPSFDPAWFKPLGDLFIRLIRMVVVPLVFCSIVSGAASMGNASKLGRIAVTSIVYFLLTTVVAVVIGLTVAHFIAPGAGVSLPSDIAQMKAVTPPSMAQTLLNIVPINPMEAMASGNLLQILFFAIVLGFALSAIGEKAQIVIDFFEQMNTTMGKITSMVMGVAPIGVFALIAYTVASFGLKVLLPLAMLVVTVYVAAILQIFLVYVPLIKGVTKLSLSAYFRLMLEPFLLAFTTCSSVAALPANMRAARGMGASKEVCSFVIPLGTTVNMDGAALYLGIAACFVAEVYGITLGMGQQVTIVVMSLIASIGSVGVPGSALIVMTMVFSQIGLPIEGIALVAGIDRVLDMARTTINIMGDSTGAVLVSAMVDKETVAEEIAHMPAGTLLVDEEQ